MNKNLITWVLLAIASFFLFMSGTKSQPNVADQNEISIITDRTAYTRGQIVKITIKNNTNEAIAIKNDCPQEPLDVYFYENNEWGKREALSKIDCKENNMEGDWNIDPQKKLNIDYNFWNHELFDQLGRYQIRLTTSLNNEEKTIISNEFTLEKEGFLKALWTEAFYRPIYNTLIFFVKYLPANSLGGAIILLTLLIRTILLLPSHKAMHAQKKMQAIQPKLEELKQKHKDNRERLAQETMALWREHKVSPFGSCLPILIQFPVMIALFYVVQSGLNPDNAYLLYTPLQNFSLETIQTKFLGILDLQKVNIWVLPWLVGGLQFFQMKLSLALRPNKKEKEKPQKKKDESMPDMAQVNKSMVYVMPLLITLFTASVPAGVGLYWGISTLFSIGQQVVINRQFTKIHS